jgi:hypothetical protein
MRTVLIHLLRRFEFRTPYAFRENARGCETILRPKLGVPVRMRDRRRPVDW